jgi:SAM-dependent methyltransferase
MASFGTFDQRRYPVVPVREGYTAWQPGYEASVQDLMDLRLLDRVAAVDWTGRRVADLGCGTGRTGRWLRARGAAAIDGVDLTPAMLEQARQHGLHDRLVEADIRSTGLGDGAYDVAVCSLVDEHLPELGTLYAEARRILEPQGAFVLIGFHPFFMMASGMPTHFDGRDGPVAIETHLHLPSTHMAAARSAGFVAVELHEALVDDDWIAAKPKWEAHRDWPISFLWVWRAGLASRG